MYAQHFSRVRVHRNPPFLREQASALFVNVAAGGKFAVRVCRYCPGMGAWFFPQAVFLKQAGDSPKPYNGRAYHKRKDKKEERKKQELFILLSPAGRRLTLPGVFW
jgi:hypothetical protein